MKSLSKFLLSGFLVITFGITNALPVQAATILFQDDTFDDVKSDAVRIGSNDAGANNTAIQFGNDSTASENGNITWNISTNKFGVDHTVDITGGLSATGAVNFSGSSQMRLRESANPTTSAACANAGELIMNTTFNRIEICTVTGGAGAATWVLPPAADANTLDTIDSTQFLRSDTSDNFTSGTLTTDNGTTFTVNGVANIGDNGDAVAVNSNTWDISAAGVGSGFTGFSTSGTLTSSGTLSGTGTINFSTATSFLPPQASSDPASCTVGQQFYNTTSNKMKICTATNTWSPLANGTIDFEAVYGADADATLTTTNGAFTIAAGSGSISANSTNASGVSLNTSVNGPVNIGTGTSTGTVTLGGTGAQTIAVGNGAGAKTVGLGSSNTTSTTTLLSGSGGVLVNDANNQPTSIGTGTSTGTVTVGGTGTQTIAVGNGAGVKTVNVGSSNTTSTTTILSGSGGVLINDANNQPTSIGTGTSTGTVTVGGTGTQTIAVGNGAGVKTVNLGSSNTTSTTTLLSGSGAVNVNVNNNQPTNIGTGTTTGTVTIGGSAAQTITIGNGAAAKTINLGSSTAGSTITELGSLNASGTSAQRIRESVTPNTSAACTTLNEVIMDTTEHVQRVCTTTGAAGVAVWTVAGASGGNYSAASDNTTQTLTTLGTWKDIVFATNDQLNGWTHTAATGDFTCTATGFYLVTLRAGMLNNGTDTTFTGQLRALNNTTATEVPGSNVAQALRDPASHYSNVTTTFMISVTANDVMKFQFTGNRAGTGVAGDLSLRTTPPTPASVGATRSANVTIIRLK